ncbi:hypothetical protein Gotur_016749 [Gossypium turneri]
MANQLKERQCLVVATGFDIFTVSQTFSNPGWVIENRTALQKVEWMAPISSCSCCCAYAGWMVLLCWLLCGLPFQLSGLFELSSSSVDYFVVDDVIDRTVGPACMDKVEWGKANLFVPHIPKHLLVALNGNSVEATYQR